MLNEIVTVWVLLFTKYLEYLGTVIILPEFVFRITQ
jgi:hypothetical protein